jgi:uncharacterized membrane protein YeiB
MTVASSRLPVGQDEWEPASVFWDAPDRNDHAPALWFAGVPILPANPPPLLLLVLESIFCTGLSVGLLTLFREKLNRPSAFFTALGADAFAAYLIHELFVVPLQYAMGPVAWGALPKFLTVGAASVVLSFLGARLLRRIPGVRSIL